MDDSYRRGSFFFHEAEEARAFLKYSKYTADFKGGFALHFHGLRVRLFLSCAGLLPRIYRPGYDANTVYKLTLN